MGSIPQRTAVHTDLGIKLDPISKITKAERPGSMRQVVEHLPNKREALISNPSTAKIK
jgi:hypothetical protein